MAGGAILPSSIYVGGAGGNLAVSYYIPTANTNNAGAIEGIAAVASMPAPSPAVLQFNLPVLIPSGICKLRALAWANAASGLAVVEISDGQTGPGSNIGAATLTVEPGTPAIQQAWAGSAPATTDTMVENKIVMSTLPTSNFMYTVLANFTNSSGGHSWTLAQASLWQFSLIWE